MIVLSPSILGADFKNLERDIRCTEEAGATWLHLDVMDGCFVPSISFGMPVISSLRSCSNQLFDVHMMVEDPGRSVEDVRKCGADLITVHAEACKHLDSTINQILKTGAKAGVALNPATPIETIDLVLPLVDMVLIMSVNPGFGVQKFIHYALEKVRALRKRCNELGLSTMIQVDGGVTLDNVRDLLDAGADSIVAGSSVFRGDAADNTKKFLEIFKEYE